MFTRLMIVLIVFLMVVEAAVLSRTGRARRYHAVASPATGDFDRCRTSPTSPADLLAPTRPARPHRRRPPRRRRRGGASAARSSATSHGPPPSPRTRPTVDAARWLIWEAAQALGARSASIHELYMARARGEVHGLHRAGHQPPGADVRHGPDGLRDRRRGRRRGGDPRARAERADVHVPAPDRLRDGRPRRGDRRRLARARSSSRATTTSSTPRSTPRIPEARPRRSGAPAGSRSRPATATSTSTRSTLVDLSKPTVDEQQRENYVRAAELTALIRSLETDGVTISVGGEIGEVGKKNSTEEELRAYLDGYRRELDARAPGRVGLSKVSVQTGTSHGGVPLPDGTRRRGQARLRGPPAARRGRPGVRARRRRPARRLDAARRAVPPLPGGRDGRDPPRDRLPEPAVRAPGVPRRAPPGDRGLVLRQRRRRAQGRPDRRAVRLHDPQEGDRAVQARSSGTWRRRRRSSRPSAGRSPSSSRSWGERIEGDGRGLRPSGRDPPAAARRTPRERAPAADGPPGSGPEQVEPEGVALDRQDLDRREPACSA